MAIQVGVGVALFLFIPLVLFLLVAHPAPISASLAAGVALMLGHRFLARPYMRRVLDAKCLWCNRLATAAEGTVEFPLRAGAETLIARACPAHRPPLARFFGFLDAARWPLRLGIFVPLLVLVGALAAAAAGEEARLPAATAFFKLAIGVTVNVAALGALLGRARRLPAVPFPAHNFFLLGVRNLLWILRLVGVWWIFQGARYFLG